MENVDEMPLSLPYRTELAGTLSALVNMWWAPTYRAALIADAGQVLGVSEARLLWELGHRARARPSELARAMDIGAPSISKAIAKLSARGLVELRQSGTDRRVYHVSLTPSGTQVARRLYDVGDDLVAGIVADWEPERVRLFTEMLVTFVAAAARRPTGHEHEESNSEE